MALTVQQYLEFSLFYLSRSLARPRRTNKKPVDLFSLSINQSITSMHNVFVFVCYLLTIRQSKYPAFSERLKILLSYTAIRAKNTQKRKKVLFLCLCVHNTYITNIFCLLILRTLALHTLLTCIVTQSDGHNFQIDQLFLL